MSALGVVEVIITRTLLALRLNMGKKAALVTIPNLIFPVRIVSA
jgi:hypothetical protein